MATTRSLWKSSRSSLMVMSLWLEAFGFTFTVTQLNALIFSLGIGSQKDTLFVLSLSFTNSSIQSIPFCLAWSSGAEETATLLDLIHRNFDSFLCKHPDGLAVVCGDFNPPSTGLMEKLLKQATSLAQVVKVLTRDTGILDWCLTNMSKLFDPPQQLPKLGTSDHCSVLIQPSSTPPVGMSSSVNALSKRDLRPSLVDAFGRWITQIDWRDLYNR